MRVFIGYDPRQPVAFQTLAHSIWEHAESPIAITRLNLKQLPITRRGLTEFTYSRFLVPYLCGYEGPALFVDSDFLCRSDVTELLAYPLAYPDCAVFICKNKLKFEWPSLMLFNTAHCKSLTPEYIEDAKNKCFDFAWADKVGELPPIWNHLVGYDEPNPDARLVHYTQGIPCWPETKDCEYSAEWVAHAQRGMSTVPFKDLMGHSVHAKHVYDRLAAEGN
jgi:hypothetical protein